MDFRNVKAETNAMYSFQYDGTVGFEVFSQFGNENVHAPAQEVVVFPPDIEEHFFPFEDFIWVFAEKKEEVSLFLGEVDRLIVYVDFQVREGKSQFSNLISNRFFAPELFGPAKEDLHSQDEFLHAEWLDDIVIGSALESFDLIFFHGFGGNKEDGYDIAFHPDLLGYGKTVFGRHHDVQKTNIELLLLELLQRFIPVGA
jgi:hypothetical protein